MDNFCNIFVAALLGNLIGTYLWHYINKDGD